MNPIDISGVPLPSPLEPAPPAAAPARGGGARPRASVEDTWRPKGA